MSVTDDRHSVVELGLMNDLRIICEDGAERTEYQVYNMMVWGSWAIAVWVFQGCKMKSYTIDPQLDMDDEFKIEPEVVLRKGTDQTILVLYPARGKCAIRPIK